MGEKKKVIVFAPPKGDIKLLGPFALTRRVQDFRVGALTIREKWEQLLALPSLDLEDDRYSKYFPTTTLAAIGDDVTKYIIPANLLPSKELIDKVKSLQPGETIATPNNPNFISCCTVLAGSLNSVANVESHQYKLLENCVQINQFNKEALLYDIELLIKERTTALVDVSNGIIAPENIFIEDSAVVRHAILNAEEGPVFIGKNAVVMEGSCLRGPVYIGDGAVVKMGATIYGATTIGPGCVVGGEIKNSVFFANSNKGHDGYIGDSVIGEWCNFGAGTSCSNMKNNIGEVDYYFNDTRFVTGLKKGGVIMGDYSRTAINTSINTGTVVGVSAHVFGSGLTPKIIPNFSWGFGADADKYDLEKALRDANSWKQLKSQQLTESEKNILTEIYNNR